MTVTYTKEHETYLLTYQRTSHQKLEFSCDYILFILKKKKRKRTSVEKNKVEVMKPFYIYFYVSLLTSKNY